MCDSCQAIPKLKTFEMHVRRFTKAKRRGFNSRAGVNFRYMPRPRLIDVCREQSGKIDKLKRAFWLLRQSFLRKCTRVRQMVGRLKVPLEKYACFLVQRLEFLGRWHRCLKSCAGWRGVCVRVL